MAFKTLCPGQALLTCLTSLTWVWNQWQICVCIFVCERLAMASTRKAYMLGKEWLVLLLIIAVAVAAQSSAADKNETAAPVVQDDFCPEVQYVYPYWSLCDWPLRHFQAFHLRSGQLGGLQTVEGMNLVSFDTGSQGSTFYAVPIGTRDPLLGVPVNTEVVLVNTQTRQPLTWTWGLVLTEGFSSDTSIAVFRFLRSDQTFPCPRISGARCESYHLVSDDIAPHGLAAFNVTAASRTIIVPASAGSESLRFVAILPSAAAAAARHQSAVSTFRRSYIK